MQMIACPLEKTWILHNVVYSLSQFLIKIKIITTYYVVFLEKCLLAKNNHNKFFEQYNNLEMWEEKISKRRFRMLILII